MITSLETRVFVTLDGEWSLPSYTVPRQSSGLTLETALPDGQIRTRFVLLACIWSNRQSNPWAVVAVVPAGDQSISLDFIFGVPRTGTTYRRSSHICSIWSRKLLVILGRLAETLGLNGGDNIWAWNAKGRKCLLSARVDRSWLFTYFLIRKRMTEIKDLLFSERYAYKKRTLTAH